MIAKDIPYLFYLAYLAKREDFKTILLAPAKIKTFGIYYVYLRIYSIAYLNGYGNEILKLVGCISSRIFPRQYYLDADERKFTETMGKGTKEVN